MRTWMAQARKNRGLTIKELATKLNISEGYYSMIERDQRQQKLDIRLATKLSHVFNLPLEYIAAQEIAEVNPLATKSTRAG